jgi:RND family efflux transporter MFP subunit
VDKKQRRIALLGAVTLAVAVLLVALYFGPSRDAAQDEVAATPVLAVVMTRAQLSTLPKRISATGNIAPWQEASVGTEAEGLQLTEVMVNVGDQVRRGQVLAVFKSEMVAADLAEAQASVAQAQAQLTEAQANAERATRLDVSGAMSAQQVNGYVVAARTAKARLDAAKAIAQRNRLRLAQTRVLAPSDGIITSRTATVGAVMPAGQELFRLIKDGRLEWRATVAMSELPQLVPGQIAEIRVHGQAPVQGRLRMVAPSIDSQTHNGMAYVDLPASSGVRAGTFARGFFEVGQGQALTVPQQAVLLRDGFSYVVRLDPLSKVLMTKVSVGRRMGDRVEITSGLKSSEPIVVSGLSFLSEGDTVKVVRTPANGAPANATTQARGAP